MSQKLDTLVIGHVSRDININYLNEEHILIGGAVIHSSHSAQAGGNATGVLTKFSKEHMDYLDYFNVPKENLFHVVSEKSTSIRNQYLTADKERRICTAISIGDSFTIADVPEVDSKIYHFAGLIVGDFNEDMVPELAKRGKVAVDVQGFLRHAEEGNMLFRDWENKKEMLPHISFLKTDAAEAEILTGEKDRFEAAKILASWGAREIMITHNTEVLVYSNGEFYTQPLKPRNLSGRTGRGDTCFSAYITERNNKGIEESLLYAAALVSLKMETAGPFKGNRADVEAYIGEFYK